MKKLYRKGTVHPSPPIKSDQLSFLPAAILTLAAALTPEDREVLAYLLSAAEPHRHKAADHHPPLFNCTCFSCYITFWVRWDSSPNRHLIHDIIDALEDPHPPKKHKKDRKKRAANKARTGSASTTPEPNRADSKPESPGEAEKSPSGGADCEEKGSVRKMVSFIGEKIWGVWG